MTALTPARLKPPARQAVERRSVVIIGAGPAGLAVGACLRRAGIDFVMLERQSSLAPGWRGHYDRLHLHTPKAFSALPYRAFPRAWPRYLSRDQFITYLEDYARHFQLQPRFGQQVHSVTPEADRWLVRTNDGVYEAPHVVLAAGRCQQPLVPSWPGLPDFPGPVLHSSRYRTGLPFRGARVLVVGAGNSGQEITLDLLEHGVDVVWSVRGPVNVIPREVLGQPSVMLSALLRFLPSRLADGVTFPLRWGLYGDLPRYGLKPLPFGPLVQIAQLGSVPLMDIGIVRALRAGSVRVFPAVEGFDRSDVLFTGGGREQVDAVVLATGYGPGGQLTQGVDEVHRPEGLHHCGYELSAVGMLYQIAREARRICARIQAADTMPDRVMSTAASH